MKYLLTIGPLLALVCCPALMGQHAGNGGDLALATGVAGGTPDATDKAGAEGALLQLEVTSGTLEGMPFELGFGFAGAGSDPTSDLTVSVTETGVIGLPLPGVFFLSTSFLSQALPAGGLDVAAVIPCYAPQAGVDDGLYLQALALDPTQPNGVALSPAVEVDVGDAVIPGPTSDDGNVEITFPCDVFPFYGTSHGSVFVNSNGNLTFGSGDSDFSPSESEFLADEPRIAPCWTDVSPNVGGTVTVTTNSASTTVDYQSVPAFGAASDVNTFSVILHGNGDIDMAWASLNPSASDDIVGISPGGGLSTAAEVDLSQVGPLAGGSNEAIFELGEETGCGDTVRDLAGGVATFAYDGVDAYTYDGGAGFQATVSGFSPASGDDTGGQTVTFDGVNLSSAAVYDVEFDGLSVPATFVDACTLTAVTPAHAPGAVDVEVFCDGASIALFPGGYTYVPAGTFTGLLTPGGDGSSVYTFQSTSDGDFDFYGTAYTEVWVNGNGNLTFGSGDSDFSESAAEMLSDQPRIAAFWDDIEVQNGPDGGVSYVEDATTATFDYGMEPHFSGSFTGTASCVVTLDKATGLITLAYGTNGLFNGSPDASNCIAGISPGGGLGTQNALDLNGPTASGTALDAIFQYLNDVDGPWDLDAFSVGLAPDLAGTAYTVN